MADVAPNVNEEQDFWKPAVAPRPETTGEESLRICSHCENELVEGVRFCPICGTDTQSSAVSRPDWPTRTWPGVALLRQILERVTAPLIALVLGCACIVAAIVTGYVFTATTPLDWQAIQIWRIEWLLAAIAILLAGILLKKQ